MKFAAPSPYVYNQGEGLGCSACSPFRLSNVVFAANGRRGRKEGSFGKNAESFRRTTSSYKNSEELFAKNSEELFANSTFPLNCRGVELYLRQNRLNNKENA
jgi:hypothetical protein